MSIIKVGCIEYEQEILGENRILKRKNDSGYTITLRFLNSTDVESSIIKENIKSILNKIEEY